MGRWVYGTIRVGEYRTHHSCGYYRNRDLGVWTLWDQRLALATIDLSDHEGAAGDDPETVIGHKKVLRNRVIGLDFRYNESYNTCGRATKQTTYRRFTMQKVIGQTGTTVLSDEGIQYKLSQKRTVRYRYIRCLYGYRAVVVGPFHSALYGACSFGTKKTSAKKALKHRLETSYNYVGLLMFSDVDEWDTVAKPDLRLLDDNASARPITTNELVGSAGR